MKTKLAAKIILLSCFILSFSSCKVMDATFAVMSELSKDYEYEEYTVKDKDTGKEKTVTVKKEKKKS